MKRYYYLLLLLATCCSASLAQETASIPYKKTLSPVTLTMLDLEYTAAEQQELMDYPRKLESLEYLYAASYRFQEGQVITADHRRLMNIRTYEAYRAMDERVVVYVNELGLYVELFSHQEVRAAMNQLLGYEHFVTGPVPKSNEQ